MQFSDNVGLPLYFEASPSTYKLYEKMGYETLDERVAHSAELMGTETSIEVPLMVKMPAIAGDLSFKNWRAAGFPAFETVKKILTPTQPAPKQVGVVEITEVTEVRI